MRISPISSGSVATSVWNATTRGLTNWGVGAIIGTASTSLAAATILDLRPGSGKFRIVYFGCQVITGFTFGVYDGTSINVQSADAAQAWAFGAGNQTNGIVARNNDASARTYCYTGFDIVN